MPNEDWTMGLDSTQDACDPTAVASDAHGSWGLAPRFDDIPTELHKLRWAVWRAEPRLREPGKMNKAPRHNRGGFKLQTTNPDPWGTFAEARAAYERGGCSGVGVLLTAGSGIVALDVDCALNTSAEHAALKTALVTFLAEGGYVELSPSGKGYHAYFRGALDAEWPKKAGGIELYDRVRFMTVTGHRVEALDV